MARASVLCGGVIHAVRNGHQCALCEHCTSERVPILHPPALRLGQSNSLLLH